MKEIERMINPMINGICEYHNEDPEFCANVCIDADKVKTAISQYVLKARIEELEEVKKMISDYNPLLENKINERIAKLKKGYEL